MKVSIYVVSKQAKQTYSEESFNIRKWPGMAIIKDALERSGQSVGYCGVADAHESDVVLVSITAACDWWPFIAEKIRWKKSKTKTIIGGAGVLNIRPFLRFADAFVFGRGEDVICDLVKEINYPLRFEADSVCYSDEFNPVNKYLIASGGPYKHPVALEDGSVWKEASVGCQGKCLFCGYTWQRKHTGGLHSELSSDGMFGSATEKTILELDMEHPETWETQSRKLRIVAIDGFSEKLRNKVNKPITRERLRQFFTGLSQLQPPHQIKIYNIVGLPDETSADWQEFKEDLTIVDSGIKKQKQWAIVLHNTPFRAMPCTPSAHWEVNYKQYRGAIARELREPHHKGNVFFQGNAFWAVESMGTDSLSTLFLDMIVWRGTEDDAGAIEKIAASASFWKADTPTKLATLERYFDKKKLFCAYEKGKEPSNYLVSWWNNK